MSRTRSRSGEDGRELGLQPTERAKHSADPHDSRPDEELLFAATRQNDIEAFGVLYARYREFALRVGRRWTRSWDEAEDVLHELFLNMLEVPPELYARVRFRTFLFAAVRNRSWAYWRKRRRENAETDRDTPDATRTVAAPSNVTEDLVTLVANLTEKQRDVLLQVYLHGRTLVEAADVLEVPLGTVKSRLHSALLALRRQAADAAHRSGHRSVGLSN